MSGSDEDATETGTEVVDLTTVERKEFAPGIYPDIPAEIYHASLGVSTSALKRFAEAPAKALVPMKETSFMARGSVVHCLCLEPHKFDAEYCVTDLDVINERHGKTKLELERAAGRTLVKRKVYDDANRMRDALHRNRLARELLFGDVPIFEQSFYWTHEPTGLLRRGRADITRPDLRVLADLKGTTSAARNDFSRKAADLRYPWQAASYQDGMEAAPGGWRPEAFIFICIEPEPPYLVAAYEIAEGQEVEDEFGERHVRHDLRQAREEMEVQLARFAECTAKGWFPGYPEEIRTLDLPSWYRRRDVERIA